MCYGKSRILLTIPITFPTREISSINLVSTNVVSRNESYRPNSDHPYALFMKGPYTYAECVRKKVTIECH